ncbi:YibE/F family protein [Companilactobacillus ginsenosidimutans]|uniref:Membrane protein n=1 Tax=Companilactobacillus ginsenosidimutans TaxID=1007676 RepID=A0A0H4QIZ8_9LACO|nr:YibE/F family protein [Companilactobacillus ginsenosidimutans]AKP67892.1 membrane protein [Companilactobacillus ginsenosidimutans]
MMYLLIAFIILLLIVTGTRGLSLLLGLGINIIAIIALLILIADGFNVIITTAIVSVIILIVAIYMNVENSVTANISFKTSIIITAVILLITIPILYWSSTQGMGVEDQEELEGFSLAAGVSFPQLAIATIIVNSLGVISETSVAITSGLNEIVLSKPTLTNKEVFDDGFSVGNKILSTQTNTLLFNFFATTFPLFFLMNTLRFNFGDIVNDKIFGAEVLTTVVCTIGVILTVPITAWQVSRTSRSAIVESAKTEDKEK